MSQTVRGDLTVEGKTRLEEDLTVDGPTTLRQTLFLTSFSRMGPTAIQGALTVSENLTASGSANIAETLSAARIRASGPAPRIFIGVVANNNVPVAGATVRLADGSTDTAGQLVIGTGDSEMVGAGTQLIMKFGRRHAAAPFVVASLGTLVSTDPASWSDCTVSTTSVTEDGFTLYVPQGSSKPLPAMEALYITYMVVEPKQE
jgi:hypothetical protein